VKKAVAFAELHARMSCEHLRQLLYLLRPNPIGQRLHGLDVFQGDRGSLCAVGNGCCCGNGLGLGSWLPAPAFASGWLAADQALVVVRQPSVEVDAEVLLDRLSRSARGASLPSLATACRIASSLLIVSFLGRGIRVSRKREGGLAT